MTVTDQQQLCNLFGTLHNTLVKKILLRKKSTTRLDLNFRSMMKDLHCDLRPLALAIYSLATGESKESWNNLSMDDVDDRVKVTVPHLICDLILRMVDPKNQVGPTVCFISYASENFNDGVFRDLLSTPF